MTNVLLVVIVALLVLGNAILWSQGDRLAGRIAEVEVRVDGVAAALSAHVAALTAHVDVHTQALRKEIEEDVLAAFAILRTEIRALGPRTPARGAPKVEVIEPSPPTFPPPVPAPPPPSIRLRGENPPPASAPRPRLGDADESVDEGEGDEKAQTQVYSRPTMTSVAPPAPVPPSRRRPT